MIDLFLMLWYVVQLISLAGSQLLCICTYIQFSSVELVLFLFILWDIVKWEYCWSSQLIALALTLFFSFIFGGILFFSNFFLLVIFKEFFFAYFPSRFPSIRRKKTLLNLFITIFRYFKSSHNQVQALEIIFLGSKQQNWVCRIHRVSLNIGIAQVTSCKETKLN